MFSFILPVTIPPVTITQFTIAQFTIAQSVVNPQPIPSPIPQPQQQLPQPIPNPRRLPDLPNNRLPDRFPINPPLLEVSPDILQIKSSAIVVPQAVRLGKTARMNDLSILLKIIPEKSYLVHIFSNAPGQPCAFSFCGKAMIPTMLKIKPGEQPNREPTDLPPNFLVSPEAFADNSPNPSSLVGSADCLSQADQTKKQKERDRTVTIYQQLQQCNKEQLKLILQTNEPILKVYALNNVATTAYVMGDYLQAIDYHQQQLQWATSDNNAIGMGIAFSGLGANYGALGDYDKAMSFYQQALEKLPENLAPQWRALVLRNIGNASLIQKQYSKAIDYQQQSLILSKQINDRYGEAQAYSNLGNIYAENGNFPLALASYQQSLTIAQAIGDRFQEAQAYLGLATTSGYQRNFPAAVNYNQQSLKLMRDLQARLGEGIALTNLGDSLFRLSRFAESEQSLKEGIAVWESLRSGLGNNDAFKVSIFETQSNTYRNLQEALIAQNKAAPALEIAERSRARAFIELLARHRNPTTIPNITPPNIDQIRQIAINQKTTIVQYSIMRDQFVENPHGGSVQFTSEPKNSALFIWVIQPNGKVNFRQVAFNLNNPKDSLAQLVSASRNAIGTRSFITFKPGDNVRRKGEPTSWQPYQVVAVNPDRTVQLSHPQIRLSQNVSIDELYPAQAQAQQFYQFQQLHEKLITPIADLLPSNPNETIVFVPQEQLFLVPFAALQNSKGEFLIEKHAILTVPAIQLLGLQTNPPQSNQNALIIGNPSPMPANYSALPGSELEANSIAKIFPSNLLINQSATESAVKAQLATAKIIHLATHASFDEQHPLEGSIALAPSNGEDGFLTAEEILKIRLQANLVVLSGCDTGRGKITGDGVLGLSRSWMAAGTPNLLVSLWQVDDQSTASLMQGFYQSLQQQPNKAIALRSAMLNTLKQYPSPRYWSAFTLIGMP
jgi:CHAT domain-containing protein/Flp pilus assembly protein TadD